MKFLLKFICLFCFKAVEIQSHDSVQLFTIIKETQGKKKHVSIFKIMIRNIFLGLSYRRYIP